MVQGAPRILIFSIAMGAKNLSCVKSIETHAHAFLPLNILAISTVYWTYMQYWEKSRLFTAHSFTDSSLKTIEQECLSLLALTKLT